ncbi:hypothetical protein WR25_22868 isoform D [Diploscapter pachys]|uniref:AB hydrolase-1 domain-containing protein n=1 Tax=Diploscapter pachys TaxID=2018661 RepID=A0A2A2K790_9BILA|nr:hypothetical protein WR25_22868 isoform D [Diploscapter pachys]
MSSSLQRISVRFRTGKGQELESEVIYSDTMPSGSQIATVCAVHGTPGSHSDFKKLASFLLEKRIRLICPNFPGLGITKGHQALEYTNEERQNFLNAFLDNLNIREKLIMIGHSRGSENALMTAVQRNAYGLILVNGTGLRIHHAIKPIWKFRYGAALYFSLTPFQSFLNPYYKKWFESNYNMVAKRAELVPRFMKTVANLSIEGTAPFIEKTKELPMKIIYVYGGKDHLIENDIQEEVIQKYSLPEMSVKEAEDTMLLPAVADSFKFGGKVCF